MSRWKVVVQWRFLPWSHCLTFWRFLVWQFLPWWQIDPPQSGEWCSQISLTLSISLMCGKDILNRQEPLLTINQVFIRNKNVIASNKIKKIMFGNSWFLYKGLNQFKSLVFSLYYQMLITVHYLSLNFRWRQWLSSLLARTN